MAHGSTPNRAISHAAPRATPVHSNGVRLCRRNTQRGLLAVRLRSAAFLGLALAVACGGSDDSGLTGGGGAAGSLNAGSGQGGSSSGGSDSGGTGSGGSGGQGGSAGQGGAIGGPCQGDDDCSAVSQVCDTQTKVCVDCLFTTQCGTLERCQDKSCVPLTECANSLDCVNAPQGTICDPTTGFCEECVAPGDCGGTSDCIANRCVAYTPCDNSLDCTGGDVCNPATDRCVGCVGANDCSGDEECVDHECVSLTECQSDNQCTPLGLLCDEQRGHCVQCLRNPDCPDVYHCDPAGTCVVDVCAEDESRCVGVTVQTCNSAGDGFAVSATCGAQQSCVQAGTTAECKDWVCDAGKTYCDGDTLIDCAADGFSVDSSTDCTATGLHCYNGECKAQVCDPNSTYCNVATNAVMQCSGNGQSATVLDQCTASEYCDAPTSSCKTQVCAPSQPVCDGNVATTCNALGSGYASGGTNCTASGKTCVGGVCSACPAGNAAQSAVRMIELHVGDVDYIVLRNTDMTCSADLQGMEIGASAGNVQPLITPLPSFVLGPGQDVYVVEPNGFQTGDIQTSGNIIWIGNSFGYALLCRGACTVAANVVDAVGFGGAVELPSPLSMVPSGLTGITSVNEDSHAYRRSAFSGAYPAFQSSDWTVGLASRPSM